MTKRYDKELSVEDLAAMPDSDIDYSDIPELDKTFWKNAKLTMPAKKEKVTIRIDADVIEWFKSKGKGYQSHMNAILKAYVHTQLQDR
ncbi:BrnA antitoxin family protein [Eilatimonas milleporae]|uniref:Uncharacterized protein (DUF4415 family) n=1 Tax=Eilatimonas milleporae TaxID=911205 RepID=A0A3M0CEE1_9PROT|nr:BrnA antitoxin family protein [Eilatimonas milleporae]RMB08194.1 uncharacterized protein (DUF4415 family) [Eilatimonas milleporae]